MLQAFTSYVLNMFRTLIYPSSGSEESACNTDTTPTQPHQNSNTHRTKNNTTNVVIQQNSCKLLMMDILMPETCWAHKKWNKMASEIKLVFYSSTITMMHGPINIRYTLCYALLWQTLRRLLHYSKNFIFYPFTIFYIAFYPNYSTVPYTSYVRNSVTWLWITVNIFLMYVQCVLNRLLSRPTNALYINNIIYIYIYRK